MLLATIPEFISNLSKGMLAVYNQFLGTLYFLQDEIAFDGLPFNIGKESA